MCTFAPVTRLRPAIVMAIFALWLSSAIAQAKPLDVRSGIYATELYNIDFQQEQFDIQLWAWFLHDDVNYVPWERLEVINAKSFDIITKSREKIGDQYFDSVKIHAVLRSVWDISIYPFDQQVLAVEIEDNQWTTELLNFITDDKQSGLDADVLPHGWSLIETKITSVENSYESTFGDPRLEETSKPAFSQLRIAFTLEREGSRLFFTIFLGFFAAWVLTTLVMIATCWNNISAIVGMQELTSISIGALFAAMANIYTLSSYIPYTTDLILADHIQFITMINVILAIVMTISTRVTLAKQEDNPDFNIRHQFWLNRGITLCWLCLSGGYFHWLYF